MLERVISLTLFFWELKEESSREPAKIMKETVIFVASQSLVTFDNSVNDVIYTELLVKIYGKFS